MTTYDIYMRYYNDAIGKSVTNTTKCKWHPATEGKLITDLNPYKVEKQEETAENIYISGNDTDSVENTKIYEDIVVSSYDINNPKYDMIFTWDSLGHVTQKTEKEKDGEVVNNLYFDEMKRINFQPWFFHSRYHSLRAAMEKAKELINIFGADNIIIGKNVALDQYIDIV